MPESASGGGGCVPEGCVPEGVCWGCARGLGVPEGVYQRGCARGGGGARGGGVPEGEGVPEEGGCQRGGLVPGGLLLGGIPACTEADPLC